MVKLWWKQFGWQANSGQNIMMSNLTPCSYCKSDYFDDIENTRTFRFFDKTNWKKTTWKLIFLVMYVAKKELAKIIETEAEFILAKNVPLRPKVIFHKRWWHTHHMWTETRLIILNNLKGYCIVCHSNVDARHRVNFQKGSMLRPTEHFKKNTKTSWND